MDLGSLPPLPVGLLSVAARDLAHRAVRFAVAAQPRLPGWRATAVLAAVLAAWLVNAQEWAHGDVRYLVAICLGSLVATAALAVGWVTEPEELERWALRALAVAVASAAPTLVG